MKKLLSLTILGAFAVGLFAQATEDDSWAESVLDQLKTSVSFESPDRAITAKEKQEIGFDHMTAAQQKAVCAFSVRYAVLAVNKQRDADLVAFTGVLRRIKELINGASQ
jgi:hypothetical protein